MAHWYLSEPFQSQAVYSQLTGMEFDFVVGMDIGNGESMVYLYDKGKNKIVRLQLNFGGDMKLATMIAPNAGHAVIGKAARNYAPFVQNFKVIPELWNEPALKIAGIAYTHGELMEAYIQTLWQEILIRDSYGAQLRQAAQDGKLLIAVGCPSSPDWTKGEAVKRYRQVVTRATGCKDVTIMAESTAAIMSAVLDLNQLAASGSGRLELNRGIAVIDAGSSTIDFTYVLLGKKLITRSLDVAGHSLDLQLLATAAKHSGLTMQDIPREQIPDILIQLRSMKESYYPDEVNLGIQAIAIWGVNEKGEADRNVNSGKRLDFTFNKQFVEEAIQAPDIRRSVLEMPMSWQAHCEKFIRDCSALIPKDDKGVPLCQKVILTGGTSFVTQLHCGAVAVYGSAKVEASPNRDASVAMGLCHAKALEIQGRDQVARYKAKVDKIAEDNHDQLLRELSRYLTDAVFNDLHDTLGNLCKNNTSVTVGSLLGRLNQKARENPKLAGAECQQKVQELFGSYLQNAQKGRYDKKGKQLSPGITDAVNEASKAIYGSQLNYVPQVAQLTQEELKALMGSLNLSKMIGNAWIKTMVPSVLLSNLSVLLALFALVAIWVMPPLGLAAAALSHALENPDVQKSVTEFAVKNKTKISPSILKKILQKMENEATRREIIHDSVVKTVESLRKSEILKAEFYGCVADQAEASLGKVLFLVYDGEPDMR